MSETDAARPTGETGASCPCVRCGAPGKSKGPFDISTGWRIYCWGSGCYLCSPEYDTEEEAWEWWNWRPASRPLPDFPAGVADTRFICPGCDHTSFDSMMTDEGHRLFECTGCGLNLTDSEWRARLYVPAVNAAPARPAAAGLRLTDEEREECIQMAYEAQTKWNGDISPQIRAALTHAESILASRATGAEVEMLNAQEMADIDAFASDKRIADPKLDPVEAIIEATVQWINARRGGGGVSDDSAMKQGRLEEMEKYSVAYYRGAVEGLYETERRLERALSISPASLSLRSWQFELCVADLEKARAENDALKQQLQALREPEYPDFAPGPWSECGGSIVDINDAPIFKIVSEEYHHKIAIRNFMDIRINGRSGG